MMTQPAAPELVELTRAPSTLEDVAAGLIRNTVGGLSIGALVWVLLSVSPLPWATVNAWAGRAALAGICLALIVYGLGDDAWNYWQRHELAADLAASEDAIAWADAELAARDARLAVAEQEISRLRAEVSGLRANRNFVTPTPEVSDPTMVDAQKLVRLYYSTSVHPTREYMVEHYGWSERRYQPALDLLRATKAITSKGSRVRWTDADEPTALRRLVSPNNADLETGDAVSPVATNGEGG